MTETSFNLSNLDAVSVSLAKPATVILFQAAVPLLK